MLLIQKDAVFYSTGMVWMREKEIADIRLGDWLPIRCK